MFGIEIKNITKNYFSNGKTERILEDLTLKVRSSEIIGLWGPNGCGKTTLFNMIAGITKPDSGEIIIHGKDLNKKSIVYIFQDYRNSLFPWMSNKDNIIFPMTIKGFKKKEIDEKLDYIRALVNIPFDLDKYPYQLSGGQQQYVSILRGLILDPTIMLVDEPFSALDYNNTLWLRDKMLQVLETIKIPTIFVAHDINHLIYISDRICLLSNKPTRVVKETEVKFKRPRKERELDRYEFSKIKREIMSGFFCEEFSYGWS